MTTDPSITRHLDALVSNREAPTWLGRYFTDSPERGRPFSGRWFERLDGGGDRAPVRDTITATDIIAVTTLSVDIPGEVAIGLLEGDLGKEISTLLNALGVDVDLWSPAADPLVSRGGPAWDAWSLLVTQPGVGWVKAGKLLARKRPRLVPVYDDVVRCVIGKPRNSWAALRGALAVSPEMVSKLDNLRNSYVPAGVTSLRVLDVIAWMSHHEAHRRGDCPK